MQLSPVSWEVGFLFYQHESHEYLQIAGSLVEKSSAITAYSARTIFFHCSFRKFNGFRYLIFEEFLGPCRVTKVTFTKWKQQPSEFVLQIHGNSHGAPQLLRHRPSRRRCESDEPHRSQLLEAECRRENHQIFNWLRRGPKRQHRGARCLIWNHA